jgi:DNA-binding CsgD family transcriptional regulator
MLNTVFNDIEAASDIIDLRSVFQAYGALKGAEFFTCFTVGENAAGKFSFKPRHLYGCFDHPWPLNYANKNFYFKDAALTRALAISNNGQPVQWSKIEWRGEAAHVFNEARMRFGFVDGVVFPIQNQNGSVSIFTVAGQCFAPSQEDISLLQTVAHRTHIKALQLFSNAEQFTAPQLTECQRDVLRLKALGFSNRAIANELGINTETVKTHAASIHKILGSRTIRQAIFLSFRYSLETLHSD